jgi:hypothetical protein
VSKFCPNSHVRSESLETSKRKLASLLAISMTTVRIHAGLSNKAVNLRDVATDFLTTTTTVSPGHFTSHVVYPLTNQSTTPCVYPASGTH